MKKIILISTVLFLSGITIRAGEVFPSSDAIWNMHQYSDNYFESEIIYGLIGDTIINEKTYQKMYFLADTVLSLEKAEYVGGFRTEGEQVWFLIPQYPGLEIKYPEFLLYDFSKKPGEYVDHGLVPRTQCGPLFLPTLDSYPTKSLVLNTYSDQQGRKHIETTSGEWIEGIGGINGFFCSFYMFTTGGDTPSQNLACFKHKDRVQYLTNRVCNKCFCTSSGVNTKDIKKEISVQLVVDYKKNIIQIEIPIELQPAEITLYDLSGMLIYSQSLSESSISINLSTFQPGTYIYRINRFGKSLQSGKIITN